MSGQPTQDEPATAPSDAGGEAGVIPVEVEAPAAPTAGEAGAAPGKPVDASAARIADLEAKVAGLEKEKKDHWDRYLRAAADLENLRKRQKRELEDAKFDTRGKVLKEMLPVVDNLERAIEHAAAAMVASGEKNPIVEGVQLVLRQFLTAFERLDVHPVDASGQPFDPNLHEAISQQESDAAPGTVVQVLQRGYKSGDRLLRPSLVVVAKARTSPAPAPEAAAPPADEKAQ